MSRQGAIGAAQEVIEYFVPKTAVNVGFGATAALALKVSIPGGMLYGAAYRIADLASFVLGKLGFDALSYWPRLGMFYGAKVLLAGAAASYILPLSTIYTMTAIFCAVDAVSHVFFSDCWLTW